MKKENALIEKSFNFTVQIVNLSRYLKEKKSEYVLSNQILKSGTSIGANIEESVGAFSRKDFFAKLTIAYKEARETRYWLRLLLETKYISEGQFISLDKDCEELLKIIGTIQKTLKKQSESPQNSLAKRTRNS